jgi:hypothetical protein
MGGPGRWLRDLYLQNELWQYAILMCSQIVVGQVKVLALPSMNLLLLLLLLQLKFQRSRNNIQQEYASNQPV